MCNNFNGLITNVTYDGRVLGFVTVTDYFGLEPRRLEPLHACREGPSYVGFTCLNSSHTALSTPESRAWVYAAICHGRQNQIESTQGKRQPNSSQVYSSQFDSSEFGNDSISRY